VAAKGESFGKGTRLSSSFVQLIYVRSQSRSTVVLSTTLIDRVSVTLPLLPNSPPYHDLGRKNVLADETAVRGGGSRGCLELVSRQRKQTKALCSAHGEALRQYHPWSCLTASPVGGKA